MKLATTLLSMALLVGCAAVKRIPFPVDEYSALPTRGTAEVHGQAFLKTRGGDVKLAAGNEIRLTPATSYSRQWYVEKYLGRRKIEPHDPRLDEFIRTTIADADGRFKFTQVPAGEHFLLTHIFWHISSSSWPEGGLVCTEISVPYGERVDVVMTH